MLFGLLLVAILAIGAIVGIIVLIYDNKNSGGSTTKPPLQLEELLKGQYQPKRFNGTWISDTHFHYFDADVRFSSKLFKKYYIKLHNIYYRVTLLFMMSLPGKAVNL